MSLFFESTIWLCVEILTKTLSQFAFRDAIKSKIKGYFAIVASTQHELFTRLFQNSYFANKILPLNSGWVKQNVNRPFDFSTNDLNSAILLYTSKRLMPFRPVFLCVFRCADITWSARTHNITLKKNGPNLGLHRVIPHSPITLLESSFHPIRKHYSDSCCFCIQNR